MSFDTERMHDSMRTESTNTEPIFIVGSSRSGTSLLAAMLGSHSQITCGPESQILPKTSQKQRSQITSDPHWPALAVQHLASIKIAQRPIIDAFGLNLQEVTDYLQNHPPSIASLIRSITVPFSQKQNKTRWAEKTPRNLLYLDLIRAEFPKAKIIRIIRDPRDSALSMRKLPWASDEYLPNLILWCEWYHASDTFFEHDKGSISIIYEDLVKNPNKVLHSVCDFIGEKFELGMLDTSKSGKMVSTQNETWKQQVSKTLAPSRLYRWKLELSSNQNVISESIAYKWLLKFGYQTSSPRRAITFENLSQKTALKNQDLILSLATDGYSIETTTSPTKEKELHFFVNQEDLSSIKRLRRILKKLCIRTLRSNRSILHIEPCLNSNSMTIWLLKALSSKFKP